MNRRNFVGGLLALGFALSGFKPKHPEPEIATIGSWSAQVCDSYGRGVAGSLVTCSVNDGREYRAYTDERGIATFKNVTIQGDGYARFFTARVA